jgi:hypothetical protein
LFLRTLSLFLPPFLSSRTHATSPTSFSSPPRFLGF